MKHAALIFLNAALCTAIVILGVYRQDAVLFIVNAKAGCWPWSPTRVEYYQGMTICPGQSVVMKIPLGGD